MWYETAVSRILNISYPIIQAPMAGGPTRPGLVAAISNSGGLGSFGAGYTSPDKLRLEIHATRKLTDKRFAVNVFVPETVIRDQDKIKKIIKAMKPYRDRFGLDEQAASEDINLYFHAQIKVIIEEKVPVVSFTFGIPDGEILDMLRSENIKTIGTATTVDEAIELEKKGVELIVAQGSEAGGHRGSFQKDPEHSLVGTMALIPQVVDNVKTPVVAAGGIMDGRGIVASFALGASGVQLGTAFLTCIESGASDLHKEAIIKSNESDTRLTRMFSGKLARGINNRFIEEMEQYKDIVPDYPIQNAFTRDIRKASAESKDTDYMSLWAGQGVRLSRSLPAAELMSILVDQTDEMINKIKDW